MTYRLIRNITISKSEEDYVRKNHNVMLVTTMSKLLNVSYQKLHKNMRLMGLVKKRKKKKVIKSEFFNLEEFSKSYRI